MRTVTTILAAFLILDSVRPSAYSDPAPIRSNAATPVVAQHSVDARVALDAMTLSLRAVRSGTCRMQCRYQYSPNQEGEGEVSSSAENIFIAFDKSQDLYRYDDLETRHSGRPDQIIVRPDIVLSSPGDWTIKGDVTHSRMIVRRLRGDVENPFRRHRDPFLTVLADCGSNRMNQTHFGFLDRLLDETLPTSTIVSYEKVDPTQVCLTLRKEYPDLKVTGGMALSSPWFPNARADNGLGRRGSLFYDRSGPRWSCVL